MAIYVSCNKAARHRGRRRAKRSQAPSNAFDFLVNRKKWPVENARLWHSLPYTTLKEKGYERVPFTGNTTKFGMPDGIWYSASAGVTPVGHRMLDAISTHASDHNGLIATFIVR